MAYQRKSNDNVILTEAMGNAQSSIISQPNNDEDQNDEDDIDYGECGASGDWIFEVMSWPGRYNLLRWMHGWDVVAKLLSVETISYAQAHSQEVCRAQ